MKLAAEVGEDEVHADVAASEIGLVEHLDLARVLHDMAFEGERRLGDLPCRRRATEFRLGSSMATAEETGLVLFHDFSSLLWKGSDVRVAPEGRRKAHLRRNPRRQ
jgi:hypothetical protein